MLIELFGGARDGEQYRVDELEEFLHLAPPETEEGRGDKRIVALLYELTEDLFECGTIKYVFRGEETHRPADDG